MSSRRAAAVTILCLAAAYAVPLSDGGWNQGAHYALVRAIWRGNAVVDQDLSLTGDVARVGGHYYVAKAPGLALASTPTYAILHATGLLKSIERRHNPPDAQALIIWLLGLLVTAGAAALLLALVRVVGDRVEAGFGLATAVTLGVGTLLLAFATLYFAHVLSALLAFAGLALLWRERTRSSRPLDVCIAGLLLGLAVTTEYTTALVGAPLLAYVLVRPGERVRRATAYVAGAIVGILPLLAVNQWAYASPFHVSYENAVSEFGSGGNDVLHANSSGFFGIGLPSPHALAELLIGSRGLLTISPVLAMSVVGLVRMSRRGLRPESVVIASVAALFLLFNAGYYLPLGGDTPGPRFLVPLLPFLAVPLAASYRALPTTTLALAAASAVTLVVATTTFPLLPGPDTALWFDRLTDTEFRRTAASVLFSAPGWTMPLAFLIPVAVAIGVAARATPWPEPRGGDIRLAVGALAVWTVLAGVVPRLGTAPGVGAVYLVVCAAAVGAAVVACIALSQGRRRDILKQGA